MTMSKTFLSAFLIAIIVSGMALVSTVHFVAAQGGTTKDWSMFRANPSHDGVGTGNSVLTPTSLWNFTTGGWVGSSPAVVGGVVYISSYYTIYSNGYGVYALNATTGSKLWNYQTANLVSDPVVVNGVVYFGAGNILYALGTLPTPSPSPTSSNTLPILIGMVVAVVVVAAVVFLMFQKRLKTKREANYSHIGKVEE